MACAGHPWRARQPGLAALVFVGATEGKRGSKWPRLAPEIGRSRGRWARRAAAESPASGAPVPGGVESLL